MGNETFYWDGLISISLTLPGQLSPWFHVEAWLPVRNREMDVQIETNICTHSTNSYVFNRSLKEI